MLTDHNRHDLVFVDVGCQKGIYTTGLLDEYPYSSVYAFDALAHPEIISLATHNAKVVFKELAIGNGSESNCTIHWESQTTIKLPTHRLDDLIRSQVHFLKIDVDGEHSSIIQGSHNILSCSTPLVMIEMSVNIRSSINVEDMISLIIANGNIEDKATLRLMTSLGYKLIAVRNGMNCFFAKYI